mmetsp:Transcript_68959/g.161611  ORF Transcript_68959/g.161611 Transcript_68959/m.161611 type:complete len:80 (-) Transcript_68959:212-451(-)
MDSDAVTGFFFVVLVLALALFSALFFQSPGLRKALWDLLSEALGGDDEDEDKEGKEDDGDAGDERVRREKRGGGKKKRR